MQTDVARMIFTDEPFNVAIGGHVTGGEQREFAMASGEMTDEQFLEFNRRWIGALRRRIKSWGEARLVEGDAELVAKLMVEGYKARPEQAILFTAAAWDSNC